MGLGKSFSFLANPDLVGILGDMDLNLGNFNFCYFWDSKFPDVQVPRFPEIWPGSGLGLSRVGTPVGPREQIIESKGIHAATHTA